MEAGVDPITFSAMQVGTPFKTYTKTVLGKVFVTYLDPFTNKPTGWLLEGNPRRNDDRASIKIWSEAADMFFRTNNKRSFENGTLIDYVAPKEDEGEKEKPIESYSDDELKEVINRKYFALQSLLNNVMNEAVLFRMQTLAKELEKSEKIVNLITARLSEVQSMKPKSQEEEDYS